MKKLLQTLCMVFAMIFILSQKPAPAEAAAARYELPFEPNARAYLLVSLDTNEIIFEKNSQEQYDPASITKLLTSYTAMKYVDDLDNTMVTAPRYVYDELYGLNSSTADIRQGEVLSMKDLIYSMMLPSANEAANIVADYIGNGSIENFCMMMNNEARKLGCTNTNFTNAHGLFTDNHYTSAYDIYLIARACWETPGFMDIVTTNTYQLPANVKHANPYFIQNTNRMQNRAYPDYYRSYIKGMKTGTLDYANFVTICQKNGENYLLVVIGSDFIDPNESRPAFAATAQIMDYFFETYSMRNANTLTYPVTDITVKYARDTDSLLLYADNEVMSILPNDADESSFRKIYNLPENVSAPVKAGDVIGTVDYYLAGQKVGTSQLVSHSDVERSTLLYIMGKLTEMFTSLYFRVVVAVTLTLFVFYLIYIYRRFKKHEKMQKVHRRR